MVKQKLGNAGKYYYMIVDVFRFSSVPFVQDSDTGTLDSDTGTGSSRTLENSRILFSVPFLQDSDSDCRTVQDSLATFSQLVPSHPSQDHVCSVFFLYSSYSVLKVVINFFKVFPDSITGHCLLKMEFNGPPDRRASENR